MRDDEPSEITNDEKVTGGVGAEWEDSVVAAALDLDSWVVEAVTEAASPPPLALRSRMTNPCSSAISPTPTLVEECVGTLP